TGTIQGASRIEIGGTSLNVASDGSVSGRVPLSMGEQALAVAVFDRSGNRAHSEDVTVTRQSPDAGLRLPKSLAVADSGSVFYLQGRAEVPALRRIEAGADRPDDPAWLQGDYGNEPIDLAAAGGGTFYLLKGSIWNRDQLTLWVHDASGDRQMADLSGRTIRDMEVGPEGAVYVTSGNRVLRVAGDGTLAEHAVLDAQDQNLRLDASSWGLVAASDDTGQVYRIGADGRTTRLHQGRFRDFAVDGSGRVCFTRRPLAASLGSSGDTLRNSNPSLFPNRHHTYRRPWQPAPRRAALRQDHRLRHRRQEPPGRQEGQWHPGAGLPLQGPAESGGRAGRLGQRRGPVRLRRQAQRAGLHDQGWHAVPDH
ncbi:MAG: hypothetical protein ABEJ96_07260, partial [Thiohalorhabdaceae bacterium]